MVSVSDLTMVLCRLDHGPGETLLIHYSRLTIEDHTIGSPLALASESYAEKAWVEYKNISALQMPNIRLIQGSVRGLNTSSKIASVATHNSTEELQLEYDYLVAATGLRRAWPVVPQSLRRKQYLFEVGDHLRNVQNAKLGVVVVGGGTFLEHDHLDFTSPHAEPLITITGAVGIEMATELKLIQPHTEVTLVHSRDKLLSAEPLPDEVKDKALELVREANVHVLMSHRLEAVHEVKTENQSKYFELRFNNGHVMRASEVIMAISKSVPATTYIPQSALDMEGYVKIHAK